MVWFSYIPCEQKENKCVPRFCTDTGLLHLQSFPFPYYSFLFYFQISSFWNFPRCRSIPWAHPTFALSLTGRFLPDTVYLQCFTLHFLGLLTMFPSSLSHHRCSWCSFLVSPREPELSFASQFPHYFKNWHTGWWYNHVGSNIFYHAPRAGA